MKPEKLQTIFIHWLNAALQDPRWRSFIRARMAESELPVIEFEKGGRNAAKSARIFLCRGMRQSGGIPKTRSNQFCE